MRLPSRPWLRHDQTILGLAFLAGLPGSAVALVWLWTTPVAPWIQWGASILIVAAWVGLAVATRRAVVKPLQTLANLLSALRHEDFTIDGRVTDRDDVLGLVFAEVNDLREVLRDQRIGALEATALLRKVVAEIDVAIFAFDGEDRLRLVNRAGERLLDQPRQRLLGRTYHDLELGFGFEGEPQRTFANVFPGASGRFELRRSRFREGGRPHHLLVITDLSRVLREEEREAWRRLIRVFSHEVNNSLTPIHSIAETLRDLLDRTDPPPDRDHDLSEGLHVISRRAESLQRFMSSYARLARLPPPRTRTLDVGEWVRRTAKLETDRTVQVLSGPDLTIQADADQLEQMLINLVQNATEAVEDTGGAVQVGWEARNGHVEVWVQDEGPGLASTANLFVPFFTTKPHGSGIGLALSRQIAEAHGGSLVLENRSDGSGCRARVLLPLQ